MDHKVSDKERASGNFVKMIDHKIATEGFESS